MRAARAVGQRASFRLGAAAGALAASFLPPICRAIPSRSLRSACPLPAPLTVQDPAQPASRGPHRAEWQQAARCAPLGRCAPGLPPPPCRRRRSARWPRLSCHKRACRLCCVSQMARALGKALRETGQALDRLGRTLQGNFAFREERECSGAVPAGNECCSSVLNQDCNAVAHCAWFVSCETQQPVCPSARRSEPPPQPGAAAGQGAQPGA